MNDDNDNVLSPVEEGLLAAAVEAADKAREELLAVLSEAATDIEEEAENEA